MHCFLDPFAYEIFDAHDGYEYKVLLDLAPLAGDAIDLLVGNHNDLLVGLGEVLDRHLDLVPGGLVDLLNLFVAVDVEAAVGKE